MEEEKIVKIITHYGVLPQLKYFQSEVFELNEAIINAENYEPSKGDTLEKVYCNTNSYAEHIAEEIADVMVMLEQFKLYYGISSEEITKVFWEKVNRQLKRIEEEKGQ